MTGPPNVPNQPGNSTAPYSYDSYTITVDPTAIQAASDQLIGSGPGGDGVGMLGHIMDNALAIEQVMADQKLGWAGNTATEAKAFFDNWQTLMTKLFGSKKVPDGGSIVRIAMAIQAAASNYNSAIDGGARLWSSFMMPAAPSNSFVPPNSPTWWYQTAVAEVF